MKQYFRGCKTEEQVKEAFFKYAKAMHPDNGGNADEFKEMKSQYEKAFDKYKGIHVNKDGETYEKATSYTAEKYADIIEQIIHFENVSIEIIGSWIWISGMGTFDHKEQLKNLKFFYSKTKKAWYFSGEPYSKRRGRYNMKQLRNHWGSEEIETEKTGKLVG